MRPLSQAIAVSAASIACFCAGDALASAASASGFPRCDALVLLSEMLETGLTSEPMALAVGLMAACVPWAVWARRLVRAGTYRQGEEHGSARWGTLKEGRAFMDGKDPANNILLSRDFALADVYKRQILKNTHTNSRKPAALRSCAAFSRRETLHSARAWCTRTLPSCNRSTAETSGGRLKVTARIGSTSRAGPSMTS